MGGALPQTSTFRPDLRSVTLVTSSAAQFCFDKTLNAASVGTASDFSLGGYDTNAPGNSQSAGGFTVDNSVTTASQAFLDDTNPMCVDVVFPTTPNPNQPNPSVRREGRSESVYGRFGRRRRGDLEHAAQSNDADSTALTGSTTHNGTTGNTVFPDLTGVTVITSANTVNYVFNKNIGGVNVGAGKGFFIINSAGQVCRQTDPRFISFSANVVTVVFPTYGRR